MEEEKRLELAIEMAKLEVLSQIRDAVSNLAERRVPILHMSADDRVRRALQRLDGLTTPATEAASEEPS